MYILLNGEVQLQKHLGDAAGSSQPGAQNDTLPSDIEYDEARQVFHQKLDLSEIKRDSSRLRVTNSSSQTNNLFTLSVVSAGNYFGELEITEGKRERDHLARVQSLAADILVLSKQNFLILSEFSSLTDKLRQQNTLKRIWHRQSLKKFIHFQSEKTKYEKDLRNSTLLKSSLNEPSHESQTLRTSIQPQTLKTS